MVERFYGQTRKSGELFKCKTAEAQRRKECKYSAKKETTENTKKYTETPKECIFSAPPGLCG